MKPTIKERDDLASYPQVSLLIYQLLSVAQAGGMTESKAKKIYDEIHGHFSTMQGAAFWPLRDELTRSLIAPDKSFHSSDGEDFNFSDRMN